MIMSSDIPCNDCFDNNSSPDTKRKQACGTKDLEK